MFLEFLRQFFGEFYEFIYDFFCEMAPLVLAMLGVVWFLSVLLNQPMFTLMRRLMHATDPMMMVCHVPSVKNLDASLRRVLNPVERVNAIRRWIGRYPHDAIFPTLALNSIVHQHVEEGVQRAELLQRIQEHWHRHEALAERTNPGQMLNQLQVDVPPDGHANIAAGVGQNHVPLDPQHLTPLSRLVHLVRRLVNPRAAYTDLVNQPAFSARSLYIYSNEERYRYTDFNAARLHRPYVRHHQANVPRIQDILRGAQNVHNSIITNNTAAVYAELLDKDAQDNALVLSAFVDRQYARRAILEALQDPIYTVDVTQKARRTLEHIYKTNEHCLAVNARETEVLAVVVRRLWRLAHNADNNNQENQQRQQQDTPFHSLIMQLSECVERNHVVCSKGRIEHMLAALQGIDASIVGTQWTTQMREYIATVLARERERIEQCMPQRLRRLYEENASDRLDTIVKQALVRRAYQILVVDEHVVSKYDVRRHIVIPIAHMF